MKKIAIIGAGVMGAILLKTVQRQNWRKITITDQDVSKLKALKKGSPRIITSTNNAEAVKSANLFILAVKPQSFFEVAKKLKNKIPEKSVIVSIMAGLPIKRIKNELKAKRVVRAMPNLGAKIGKSMTVWTSAKEVTAAEKKIVKSLFDKMGRSLYVNDEMMIDKATAVSGSGPGFFFYIIEQWLKAIRNFGFTEKEAQLLLLATVDATNNLLQQEKNPGLLKNQVAAKGGTTEAGLKVMAKSKIKTIWQKTIQAALARAKQLSKNVK
jgi:pyrroline-5-carboxylate reductase